MSKITVGGRGCERFVLLGDVTGYGYDAKTVLKLACENFDAVCVQDKFVAERRSEEAKR